MLDTTKGSDLFRQTYARGMVIFFYGLVWLVAVLAGYVLFDSFFASSSGVGPILLTVTWASALAGAMGGVTAMLSRLYKHVSITLDIQDQKISTYLVQPLVGLVVGVLVLYVIVIPVSLLVDFIIRREFLFETVLTNSSFVAVQVLLSWIGGFYQRQGLEKIKALTRRTDALVQSPDSIDKDSPTFYKDWVDYQRHMTRWSYTWGLFLFFYGIFWLVGLLASYLLTTNQAAGLESGRHTATLVLILDAWPVAVAGAIGGVFSLLKDLYQHVSIKQDFHRQHLMSYLVQPVIGFVLGFVMYFLLASGYLVIRNEDGSTMTVDSGVVFTLQLLLGWIAGFRQQTVTDFIQQLIQDLITFFKRAGRILFNPKIWFDKIKRDRALREVVEEPSIFTQMTSDSIQNE